MAKQQQTSKPVKELPEEKQKLAVRKQIGARTTKLLEEARSFKVTNQESYEASAQIALRIDAALKWITELLKPNIKRLDEAHKAAVADLKNHRAPLEMAKGALNQSGMKWYDAEQARIKKVADEAAERARKDEQKRLEKEAKQLEKAGEKEAAAVVKEQAATVQAPAVYVPGPVQAAGTVYKDNWKWEVTNEVAVPSQYKKMVLDTLTIDAAVESLKDKANIPGIRVWNDRKAHNSARTAAPGLF